MKQETINHIKKFIKDRNWDQFHEGEHLAKALIIEAAELLELYQWKHEVTDMEKLKEEVADVLVYATQICEKYGFDMDEIVMQKMKKNALKYPVEKSFGNSKKYTEI